MENDKDVLKVLAESNYWKHFIPIEKLPSFNKPITQLVPITNKDVVIINKNVAHDEQLARMI